MVQIKKLGTFYQNIFLVNLSNSMNLGKKSLKFDKVWNFFKKNPTNISICVKSGFSAPTNVHRVHQSSENIPLANYKQKTT